MLHPARCVVAKELYWGKGRRPGAADALALDTFARLAPGADLIMDIGAYTGIFTLIGALCSPQAEVRAYEIVPANYLAAWRNLVANDLVQPRIDLQLRGVGRADTTVTVPTGEGGSALPDFYSLDLELKSGVNVPVISLDSLVGDRVPKQVLIKIDVEGNEDDIFAEGGEFLSAYRPDLLCEILAEEANLPAVRRQLSGLGYRYFLVADGQLVEFAEIFGDRLHRDWLITTKSPDDLGNLAIPAVSNL